MRPRRKKTFDVALGSTNASPNERFRVTFDPMLLVRETAAHLYPKSQAIIFFSVDEGKNAYGAIRMENGEAVITIDLLTPLGRVPEILAHEIAHAVVGIDKKHGNEWKKAFGAIHKEFDRRMRLLAKRHHLKRVKPACSGR